MLDEVLFKQTRLFRKFWQEHHMTPTKPLPFSIPTAYGTSSRTATTPCTPAATITLSPTSTAYSPAEESPYEPAGRQIFSALS